MPYRVLPRSERRLVLVSGELVSPEEYERRQAALTPQQRELQALIVGHFERVAREVRDIARTLEE